MGLDTTHDCWHGAYSAFSRWRNKLAEVAGYDFFKAGDPPIYDSPSLDWGCITRLLGESLMGKWPRVPVRPDGTPDALIVLLAHSDCEGEIQPDMCAPLADRLTELLPMLPDGEGGGHIGIWREKTQRFIDGLRLAASRGEAVEFH